MSGQQSRSRLAALRAFSAMDLAATRRTGAIGLGLFAMPLLVTAFVGLALGSYLEPSVRVGVLDRSGDVHARALLDDLRSAPGLSLQLYDDEARLRAGVHRGRLAGGLVIPPGWNTHTPALLYASDATATAALVRAHLDAAIARRTAIEATDSAPRRSVPIESAVQGGGPPPLLLGFRFTAPANLVMFALIAGCTAGARLAAMRSSGMGARLAVTPAGRFELLAGLAIGPLQLITGQALFLLVAGATLFGVAWGPPGAVALLTASLVVTSAAIALALGTLYRGVEQAVALGPFLGLGLGMLGGCWWPLEIVPPALRAFAQISPATWAMEGYLDLVARGGDATDVAPNAAALLAFAVALFALAALRLRRELVR